MSNKNQKHGVCYCNICALVCKGWCCRKVMAPFVYLICQHILKWWSLNYLRLKRLKKWLMKETFDRLQNMARKEITNLPPASSLHKTEFGWQNFESTVFFLFIHDFTSEITKVFANIQFWILISIFDPRKILLIKMNWQVMTLVSW